MLWKEKGQSSAQASRIHAGSVKGPHSKGWIVGSLTWLWKELALNYSLVISKLELVIIWLSWPFKLLATIKFSGKLKNTSFRTYWKMFIVYGSYEYKVQSICHDPLSILLDLIFVPLLSLVKNCSFKVSFWNMCSFTPIMS